MISRIHVKTPHLMGDEFLRFEKFPRKKNVLLGATPFL